MTESAMSTRPLERFWQYRENRGTVSGLHLKRVRVSGVRGRTLGVALLQSPQGLEDFAPVDWYLFRSFNPDTHFVATNIDNRDDDVSIDHDSLVALPGQD